VESSVEAQHDDHYCQHNDQDQPDGLLTTARHSLFNHSNGNFGQAALDIATATTSADRDLPNDAALRFLGTISILIRWCDPSPLLEAT
jgi:hypothetical protein